MRVCDNCLEPATEDRPLAIVKVTATNADKESSLEACERCTDSLVSQNWKDLASRKRTVHLRTEPRKRAPRKPRAVPAEVAVGLSPTQ